LLRPRDLAATENRGLVMAAKRVPRSVACLLSALRFRGLTTQDPFEVWLAVKRGARLPKGGYAPPLRTFVFSLPVFHAGIKEHDIEGVTVRVYKRAGETSRWPNA
jgi:predicted transcriptional regulator of viral defense system